MIRIFVIEDHYLLVQGLKCYFQSQDDKIEIVGFARRIPSALEQMEELDIDIILMEMFIHNTDPITNLHMVSARFPDIPIIILSCETSSALEKSVFGFRNVKAYLSKSDDNASINRVIRSVASGQTIIPANLKEDYILAAT